MCFACICGAQMWYEIDIVPRVKLHFRAWASSGGII